MAETAGYEGAIYYRNGYCLGTLTFNDNSPAADTIVGAGSLIASAGFAASDTFNVAGTSSNDGSYTVNSVAASTITLKASSTLTNESSVASVTLDSIPGKQLAGFYNWSVTWGADALECTDFGDSGNRTYNRGLIGWSATATKHYMTSSSITSWLGGTYRIRFFMKYDATPSSTSRAYYLQGSAVVTAANTDTPVDGMIGQTLNFQGTGALTPITRTTAW